MEENPGSGAAVRGVPGAPGPEGRPGRSGRGAGALRAAAVLAAAAVALVAYLLPAYPYGQGIVGRTFLAVLLLGIAVSMSFAALRLACSLPPLAAAVLAGCWLLGGWVVYSVLAAFLILPFSTNHDLTVAASLAVSAGATAALYAVGALLSRFPLQGGLSLAAFALALSIALQVAPSGAGTHGERVAAPVAVAEDLPAAPSLPGPYRVEGFTYGSGTDLRRPEFGAGATIVTRPVDGSPFVPGDWSVARTAYWGFDPSRLPLNGRVWHPAGEGPFPLVVAVHGVHSMTRESDRGFAYLGNLLASRGYVFVSVDQNFLNPGGYRYGQFGASDIDARAWLLLEHLRQWKEWMANGAGPLAGKVDLGRVALVGHSRGGEAVAAAESFNRMSRYPGNGNVRLESGHAIRSLVAFAPSDIAQPRYERTTPEVVEGASYLVVAGMADRQAPPVIAGRVYQHVRVSTGPAYRAARREGGAPAAPGRLFKAAVWIDRANHSQFNADWGEYDLGWPARAFSDLSGQMDGDEQRRAASLLVSAFLDATLRGDGRSRSLFKDVRRMQGWLPPAACFGRYQDSTYRAVADFDEDIDPSSATVPGGSVDGRGFTGWREGDLDPGYHLPFGSRANRVLSLGWAGGVSPCAPSLLIRLSKEASGLLKARPGDAITFSALATGDGAPGDVLLRLVDRHGAAAEVPLSRVGRLPSPVRYRLSRLRWVEDASVAPVLPTLSVPLSLFLEKTPSLDLTALAEVEFRFDGSREGGAYLDDIGIISGA